MYVRACINGRTKHALSQHIPTKVTSPLYKRSADVLYFTYYTDVNPVNSRISNSFMWTSQRCAMPTICTRHRYFGSNVLRVTATQRCHEQYSRHRITIDSLVEKIDLC